MNPTDWLRLGVEQYLRELSDDEFGELVQRARPPDDQPESPETDNAAFMRQVFGGGDD
ncbi:hypothetical protein MTIM_40130 [Mycobacterium timonense]|uniref:Uncharacterized protein n=1 Tax=Mycobacterium timonense TaxID=701043 RepID=A0A7I9ZAV6_9MYCO|nr:hypothetical protein MTIM_40130 [Mycobacterium timonense]